MICEVICAVQNLLSNLQNLNSLTVLHAIRTSIKKPIFVKIVKD